MALLERLHQTSRFREALSEAGAGAGQVVLIEGPVGAGKTEFLHHCLEEARRTDAAVLATAASPAEREFPLSTLAALLATGPDADLQRAVEEVACRALLSGAGAPGKAEVRPTVTSGLSDRLLGCAAGAPLVLAVDDVHHADAPSLECLLALITRIRRSGVLVLLSAGHPASRHGTDFLTEMLRQPHVVHVHVRPLGVQSVATMFREGHDGAAAEIHAACGGNPLLLRAVLHDRTTPPVAPPAAAAAEGVSFRRALLACLHRVEATTLTFARAVAVLGGDATPATVAAVTGHRTPDVEAALAELDRAGLHDAVLRHPAVCTAICEDMPGEVHLGLRRAAVETLERLDRPATALSRHLVAAAIPCDEHGRRLLHEGAEAAMREGDLEHATACVGLARRSSDDPASRAEVLALDVELRWRVSPITATPLMRRMVRAVDAGELPLEAAVGLLPKLLAAGLTDEADRLSACLHRRPASGCGDDLDVTLAAVAGSLRVTFPDQVGATETPDLYGGAVTDRRLLALAESARGLFRVLHSGPDAAVTKSAGHLLRTAPLHEDSVESIVLALSALVYSDEEGPATAAGERLRAEAGRVGAAPWHAMLTALLGEAALRAGDPRLAVRHVDEALSILSPRSWGVAVGLPLGVAVQARLALGDRIRAAAHLDVPVPAAMLGTRFGVHYLHARALLNLASRRTTAAECDLQACGDLVTRWRMDTPTFAPWRAGLALARIQRREFDEARTLLDAHLARPGGTTARVRGTALRLRAACSDTSARPDILHESVTLLRECGHRVELRRSLLSLGRAHRAVGEVEQARTVLEQAASLTEEIGLAPVGDGAAPRGPAAGGTTGSSPARRPTPSPAIDGPPAGRGDDSAVAAVSEVVLTAAEHRVADLAGRGHTNRAIAAALFITASTVEQHLTRIYKKLGVSRRQELIAGPNPGARTTHDSSPPAVSSNATRPLAS